MGHGVVALTDSVTSIEHQCNGYSRVNARDPQRVLTVAAPRAHNLVMVHDRCGLSVAFAFTGVWSKEATMTSPAKLTTLAAALAVAFVSSAYAGGGAYFGGGGGGGGRGMSSPGGGFSVSRSSGMGGASSGPVSSMGGASYGTPPGGRGPGSNWGHNGRWRSGYHGNWCGPYWGWSGWWGWPLWGGAIGIASSWPLWVDPWFPGYTVYGSPVYIEAEPSASAAPVIRLYCPTTNAFYPQVTECSQAWLRVLASEPQRSVPQSMPPAVRPSGPSGSGGGGAPGMVMLNPARSPASVSPSFYAEMANR